VFEPLIMMAQAIHVVVDVHSSASVKARDDQPMALNNIDINSQWSVSMQDLLFTITSPPLMLDVNPYKTKNVSLAVSDVSVDNKVVHIICLRNTISLKE